MPRHAILLALCVLSTLLVTRGVSLRNPPETSASGTFTVNSTGDESDAASNGVCLAVTGFCTLRAAIEEANNLGGGTTVILFTIPGAGVHTIQPASPLPTISQSVAIDAYSQPGASFNTNPPTAGSNAVIQIELNGASAGAAVGLHLTGGGSIVRGLAIRNFSSNGISLDTAGGNQIQGNFIGTNAGGTADQGNGGNGILVNNVFGNTIGGSDGVSDNVISGNSGNGVLIINSSATGNVVEGNLIGTNAAGTGALPNDFTGVGVVNSASSNTIGGTVAAARNVISANGTNGIGITGGSGNQVQGNFIGTNVSGTTVLGNTANGVTINSGAASNTIGGTSASARNVISGNAADGIHIVDIGTTGNQVLGNYIGTNAAGTAALGNVGSGVYTETANNVIGGVTTTPGTAPGNLISGNSSGVLIKLDAADGNVVEGNLIGTNAAGTAALGNLDVGVYLSIGPDNNVIGGTVTGARNVISGNNGRGIAIFDNSTGNQVQGNYIGTNISGTAAIPNGQGVTIGYSIGGQASGNTIGGLGSARNVISGNTTYGISIGESGVPTANTVIGNYIGVAADGTSALGNGSYGVYTDSASNSNIIGATGTGNLIANNGAAGVFVGSGTGNVIRGNSIHDNSGLGIDLAPIGVTPNDLGDPDTGPNNLQNFPSIASAQTGSAHIRGTLNSTASSIFLLDFYASASCDPSGNGEGQTYLGTSAFVTDGSGNATFEVDFDSPLLAGQAVTATATDSSGSTSEFSACSTATQPSLAPLAGTGVAGDCTNGTTAGSCAVNQPHGLFEVFPPSGVSAGQGEAASGVIPALYYADTGGNLVRKIQPADATGAVTTVAGGGGSLGDGGPATLAMLSGPRDVFIYGKSLYIADTNNCRIRRVDLGSNVISTVAGTGVCTSSGDGGLAINATLNSPRGVTVDASGNLYIADTLSDRIRRVENGGDGVVNGGAGETISTIAGGGAGCGGPPAPYDGCPATQATLNQPHDLYFLGEDLVIADTYNQRIRRIDYPSGIISTLAGTGVQDYTGDNGPATQATLRFPEAVMAANDKVVIADTKNHVVRMVDVVGHPADPSNPTVYPAVAPGTITTVADQQSPCRVSGCPPGVPLDQPAGVFIVTGPTAADGALRVANTLGQTIVTAGVDPTGTQTPTIRPTVSCGNVPGVSSIDWAMPLVLLGLLFSRKRLGTLFSRTYTAARRLAPATLS